MAKAGDEIGVKKKAEVHLAAMDGDWAALVGEVGPCGMQIHSERQPYESLVRTVAYQQLHGRAAKAILDRFMALYPDTAFPEPERVLATDETVLRGCGFSASKIATIRGIAEKTLDGTVPTRQAAEALADDELIRRLVTLRGVGRWTVEMLLMFTLGRPDILPVDDFGVREGWRMLKSLPEQPKPRELAEIGKAWSPFRSAAAWYLWRATERAKGGKPSEVTG